MEPTSQGHTAAHVVAVPLPVTWHDVGGYGSLRSQFLLDEHGNAVSGTNVLLDSRDNLVINAGDGSRLVAAVGLHDMAVVQTDQITVVCPLTEAERIKELVGEVAERLGPGYI
jgi:mannose-1-phosphate guanylyltransferase